MFLEGDKLEVVVRNGRWLLTHLPAKAAAALSRTSTTFRPTSSDDVAMLQ